MDKDRLINLLPEEYIPEPEFKAFPIFAAALIILTVLFVYMQYKTSNDLVLSIRKEVNGLKAENDIRLEEVQDFVEVQANARFIRSYMAVIPNMVLHAPDYWEIYNELERHIPEDTWIQSLSFRPQRGKWPSIVVNFLSKGYSFNGPLITYDKLFSTESPTRFKNPRMGGYRRIMVAGAPVASFQIQMDIRYPTIEIKLN